MPLSSTSSLLLAGAAPLAGAVLLAAAGLAQGTSEQRPPFTDYCERLEQEIQGRKHGFLAGDLTYYVGGFHASWAPVEDETIGLTHPFHHDLRSRGVGRLASELEGGQHTGTGNDELGWEFYKDTRVLFGSVIVDGRVIEHPAPTSMRWRPDQLICTYELDGVTIQERKFIDGNDAAASHIIASRPVTLRFTGHSFCHRESVSSSAELRYSAAANALLIKEGGTVRSRPDPGGERRVGPHVYSGMTTVLSASRDFAQSHTAERDEAGVWRYSLSVPCDASGTVVSWAMHDDPAVATGAARAVLEDVEARRSSKTAEMNRLFNDEVPWFRCPDERVVDIYYYLWSLYLMYMIEVGRGWEMEAHTQTAVNNFLGMHRYDAAFQIKVGAWTSDKRRLAYGNVLTWKHLTEGGHYLELPDGLRLLPDTKGVCWHSGVYGPEASEHVLGAWQLYEHTGDLDFLKACYEGHFAELFWNRIPSVAMNEFEVAQTLEEMASRTGHEVDVEHWARLVRRDPTHIREQFDQRWGANGVEDYFAAPEGAPLTTNGFWAMRSPWFPEEYARPMVEAWALDRERGFNGAFFPLAMARQSMERFASDVDRSFGYTPDTAYFTLDGMFRQRLGATAAALTLDHLLHYNFQEEWGIPVAPEAYRRDGTPFGDQYSNFNAGKLLLILEGLAGLDYSIPEDRLTVRPALPEAWDWMELRLPIAGQWTRVRVTPEGVQGTGCPLQVER